MSSDTLTAILFVAVVLITVGITFWANRQTHGTTDYYAGGRSRRRSSASPGPSH